MNLHECRHCKLLFCEGEMVPDYKNGGITSQCRPCRRKAHNANSKRRYDKDPEYREKLLVKNKARRHGMSAEDLVRLFRESGESCEICLTPLKLIGSWRGDQECINIDHCHKSGVVRGLLCNRCNVGISAFCDSPAVMDAASEYMRRSRAVDGLPKSSDGDWIFSGYCRSGLYRKGALGR